MEKEIVKELCKDLKLYERIIVRLFRKTVVKIYNISRVSCFNALLK